MVFFNNKQRAIHMGGVYFNLDVFFLNDELTVVGLQRNLSAHPGKTEPPAIDYSKIEQCMADVWKQNDSGANQWPEWPQRLSITTEARPFSMSSGCDLL